MRVIIVDDEDLARALVREFLAMHADIEIVAECANGFDAVKAITELAPDLVFLDIQMPKLNGFEVVELAGAGARYIFVTAFDQYALKAFDIHAVDYLLKPFSQQRLDAALAHARTSVRQGGVDAVLRESALRSKPLERVLIRDGARVHIIAAGQIDYIEAQDDYVRISAGGRHYLKNQRLTELESQLDPAVFVRVHRSWMLNLGAIERIEQGRDSHTAILKDATRIPISRSGYQKVRALVG
ncbi:LytR/AlgR family response regulator transcription factor [Massilia rubra]|uniref:Response regulator transcription factor n=1 Tax=Massilia rubra TaxID=2607910 RepID=A0ABX0LIL7_9BURK|nr:LytTR family DNA-binding domain-containing protein [Massilia rubra]NHZ33980.1 response regulator transcription factor [Massilia rubra]